MMTPTARSLAYLRRRGALCAVVERFNAFVTRPDGGKGVRMDLFGFIDVLAVEPAALAEPTNNWPIVRLAFSIKLSVPTAVSTSPTLKS